MQGQTPTSLGTPTGAVDSDMHVLATPTSGRKSEVGGFNTASIDATWSALGFSFLLSFAASGIVAVVEVWTYRAHTSTLHASKCHVQHGLPAAILLQPNDTGVRKIFVTVRPQY